MIDLNQIFTCLCFTKFPITVIMVCDRASSLEVLLLGWGNVVPVLVPSIPISIWAPNSQDSSTPCVLWTVEEGEEKNVLEFAFSMIYKKVPPAGRECCFNNDSSRECKSAVCRRGATIVASASNCTNALLGSTIELKGPSLFFESVDCRRCLISSFGMLMTGWPDDRPAWLVWEWPLGQSAYSFAIVK